MCMAFWTASQVCLNALGRSALNWHFCFITLCFSVSFFFYYYYLSVQLEKKHLSHQTCLSLDLLRARHVDSNRRKPEHFWKKRRPIHFFSHQKWWRLWKPDDSDGQTCHRGLRNLRLGCGVGATEAKLKIQAWLRKTFCQGGVAGVTSHQRTEGQQRERCRGQEQGKEGDFP